MRPTNQRRAARVQAFPLTRHSVFGSGPVAVILGIVLAGGAGLAAQTPQIPPAATPQQAMQQGAAAMASGRFAQAVADYSAVTRDLPRFAEGYLNLGLAQQQAGQLDAARTALEKSLELKPELRGANLFLGLIAYRQNRYKEAEASLLRETRIDPRDAKAFMWLGVCYLAEAKPEAAIAPLKQAHALEPKDEDVLYHLGRAYLLMANASYAAMFKAAPDSMRVHQVLAEAYAKAYRTKDAIAEFELAVKMAPHQPGLHEELADQYWVAGQLDQAATGYREELKIDPYSAVTMYKLGSLLVVNQNASQGVEFLRSALHEDPSLRNAHYYLGEGLMNMNQEHAAVAEFQQAIAADPSDNCAARSWYKLAMVYRKTGDTQAAHSAMQNFLRLRSEAQARTDQHTAEIARDRASLPVDESQTVAMTVDH